jgi:hypothetical protein
MAAIARAMNADHRKSVAVLSARKLTPFGQCQADDLGQGLKVPERRSQGHPATLSDRPPRSRILF